MTLTLAKRIHSRLALPLLAGLLLVGGCGGGPSVPIRSEFVPFTQDQKTEIESGSARPYRLQSDDVIKVTVSHQDDLDQEGVLVLPDGAISLIGVGRLPVAGMTLAEADSAITVAYSRQVKEPEVSVIVRETSGRLVYVLGEVRTPGLHKLPRGGLGVIGAITVAGGFTADAAPDGTVLVRITPDGYLVQELALGHFRDPDSKGLAMIDLQPYDIVYVPRSRMGDFAYFSKTVLTGLVNITRMATDIRFLASGYVRGGY